MKLTKSINLALATALFLNSAMPAFAFDPDDEPQTISWGARAGHWFGMKTEDYASQKAAILAKDASAKVRTALHGVFFGDGERYGIDADGRRVAIFTNKSNLLNNLFRQVTGSNLDDTLKAALPLGSLYVNKLRHMMDDMIVNKVLGSVVAFGVEEMVYRAVMNSYNLGASTVNELTTKFLASLQSKPKSAEQLALENTFAQVKSAKLKDIKETEEGDKAIKAAAQKIIDDENDADITLSKVMTFYKNKFLGYVDNLLKETAITGIAFAAKKLGQNVSDATINWVKGSTTMTGALGAIFVNPIAGMGAIVTGVMSHMYQKDISDAVGKTAENKARQRAQLALASKKFIQHSEYGMTTATDTIGDMEFEVLTIVDHSITAWATQKLATAKGLVETAKATALEVASTAKKTVKTVTTILQNADWQEGGKAVALETNRIYGGYNPLDIQANFRPYTTEELDIRKIAEINVPHPFDDKSSPFYKMTLSQIETLSSSQIEMFDEAADEWDDALDAEVKRLTKAKHNEGRKASSSITSRITGFFGWNK